MKGMKSGLVAVNPLEWQDQAAYLIVHLPKTQEKQG